MPNTGGVPKGEKPPPVESVLSRVGGVPTGDSKGLPLRDPNMLVGRGDPLGVLEPLLMGEVLKLRMGTARGGVVLLSSSSCDFAAVSTFAIVSA